MTCLTSLEFTFVPAAIASLWVFGALVLVWVVRNHRFAGKHAFVWAFVAMLWWLFAVVFDFASQGLSCKVGWSLAAWPAISLLPIAWAFFVFDYTLNPKGGFSKVRLCCFLGVPVLVSLIAFTNGQHHLLYGADTYLTQDGTGAFVDFNHGAVFYVIAAGLYIFVLATLGVLAYAFLKAEQNIRPFLAVLVIITVAPLVANVAYVGWEVTILGFDPTPFMFGAAFLAFSWLLSDNRMMDTEALGRDLLFYATHDPVIIMDALGQFAGANSAARELFEDKMPERGEGLGGLAKIGPMLGSLAATGELGCAEPIRFGDRIYDPRALPIASPIQTTRNLLGWTVSLVDITERERTAEALREAVVHAEAANRAKTEFLAVISHELRTPMTSLKGGLDLVLHGVVGEVSDPVRNLLNIAQKNSVRLQRLIDDVLDLQKLDLNAVKFKLQDLDLIDFLRETIEEHEGHASKAKVVLSLVTNDVHAQVHTDPYRLKQVVGNVLSNAVKFSPEGGEVECSVQVIGTQLRMSVQDSGIGIPENAEDQVFGRFNQVDSSETRASGGSGLGMHIAKLLIERMGGAISYESRLGEGTTFHIDIPFSVRAL